jgi:molecular chaperone GrpE
VLEAELRAKTEEAARNFDLYLRECAEADNFRKRLQREKAEAIRFGNEALVREILPLLDNLELAVEHAELGGNGRSVVEGIRMILRMFRDVLERNGVRPIEAAPGSLFDSTVHEAVDAEESSEVPPNTVIRQELKGYEMHGRLIRPARVVVATAPRAQTADSGEEDGE